MPAATEFLDTAFAIGARIARDAWWSGDRCTWIGASMEPAEHGWTVAQRTIGPDLYGGSSGVALFFARLWAATNEPVFRKTATGALRHALSVACDPAAPVRRSFFAGELGTAWAAVTCADLGIGAELGDEGLGRLREMARANLDDAVELDVVSGLASGIVAWLDLYLRHDVPELLEAAIRGGDAIVHAARRNGAGASWRIASMPARHDLTGLGHGASGYAWALLELFAVTGDARYRELALDAFRYERRWYDAERENWPDFRESGDASAGDEEPGYAVAWCHGAAGIGLSRVRAWQITGDAGLRAEAEAALRTTLANWKQLDEAGLANYSLCHGVAGNAELALLAARVLEQPVAARAAEAIGRAGIERYETPRQVWPGGITGGGESPSLMLGAAGTGWFFLRLHDPSIPSILLLEPGAGGSRAVSNGTGS